MKELNCQFGSANSVNVCMKGTNWQPEKMVEIRVVLGLIFTQFLVAGNTVLMSYIMNLGINPLMLTSFTALFTFVTLLPLSVLFERSKWPERLTLSLTVQFFIISFNGVTLIQTLFLKGVELTSPAIATALPNICPAIIFLMAWVLGMEDVKLSCLYSRVKLLGTLLCVVGAVMMSLLQSTNQKHTTSQPESDSIFDVDQIIGCLYLLTSISAFCANVILQTKTLREFPAPISLVTITSLIGIFLTIIVQLIHDHKFQIGLPGLTIYDLLTFSLLGGVVGGIFTSFNGWALRTKGPVFVSMFAPIATVVSVAISTISLGDKISVGSLVGMSLMFTGLYCVLWAKGKEQLPVNPERLHNDPEEPLLS